MKKTASKTIVQAKYRELSDAYEKVLRWFFAYPLTEFSLTDLCKHVQISKTTANTVVRILVEEEFLTLKQVGNIWRIRCNQNHSFNITKKIPYNLELVYFSGIISAILEQIPNTRCIVLYGSYRKGDDVETSDIDIAVEVLDNMENTMIELGIISQIGYRHNIKVNVLKFTRQNINLNLFVNIANGVVLYGTLEVKP
jgi:predicted nucleotidyltransferase